MLGTTADFCPFYLLGTKANGPLGLAERQPQKRWAAGPEPGVSSGESTVGLGTIAPLVVLFSCLASDIQVPTRLRQTMTFTYFFFLTQMAALHSEDRGQ